MKFRLMVGGIAIAAAAIQFVSPCDAMTIDAKLNGLNITLDADTGGVLRLAYSSQGTMLNSAPQQAGMIDLAYPIEKFEPLRLASRFSHDARVTTQKDAITVEWDHLGASRQFGPPGDVSAKVVWRAADDGQSVVLSAHVENHSQTAVRQIVFPDLAGLRPFLGKQNTLFRTGGSISAPFIDLAPTEAKSSQQYMIDVSAYTAEYKAGGLIHNMVMRWMDYGGLRGGMSLFPVRWGWDPPVVTRIQLSEIDDSLRLMCLHDIEIKPGGAWDSGAFKLTPHDGGWAKGIEPYRAWVKKNFVRAYPVPRHVREGLGFRTAWMCENQPNDPKDAVFTFKDLPKLAADCKENGLDEMTLWAWNRGFVLPLPPPYSHLGTEQEMVDAVAACRRLGVNVVPFISVLLANEQTAPRYGVHVTDNNGWTFHTELIPRWNPPYAHGFACAMVPISNPAWQKDVFDGAKHLIDIGVPSLGWDEYWATEQKPNINTLTDRIRAAAKAKDPESTFFGEELWNFEVDSAQLDYTWFWQGDRDLRPLASVFPAPRLNENITSSPACVKQAFADNRYINAFPRKKGSINGSDYISNYPEFSAALKQCAALRRQFLQYFTDGTLIGECILTEADPMTHVSAYVLPDRVLMVVLNQGPARPVSLNVDLPPWCAAPSGNYDAKVYAADGTIVSTTSVKGSWQTSRPMQSEELSLYEFVAK